MRRICGSQNFISRIGSGKSRILRAYKRILMEMRGSRICDYFNVEYSIYLYLVSHPYFYIFIWYIYIYLFFFSTYVYAYIGLSPFPVVVTARCFTFLVGEPYKPSPLFLYWEGAEPNTCMHCFNIHLYIVYIYIYVYTWKTNMEPTPHRSL